MSGEKSIESRSRRTKIRGTIYIYAAAGRYSRDAEAEMMESYDITDSECDELPRGVIVGTVELYDCVEGKDSYHWHLRNPIRAKQKRKPTGHPQPVWFYPFS
jgi:hypothetical protein